MGEAYERSRSGWVCSVKSVVIIGPNGQLGSDLVKTFQKAEWDVKSLSHSEIQVEDWDSVQKSLTQFKADWIINTAAFHKVDDCEKNPEKSWQINARGPENIARVAKNMKAKVAFISTDYVFSGDKPIGNAYFSTDKISPVNVYGHSKAAGEIATQITNEQNLVIRISSVFGSAGSSGKGGNFVETILKKAHLYEQMNIVDDMHMSPTYTVDASHIIYHSINLGVNGKIHASNFGSATWFQFAEEILKLTGIKSKVNRIESNWEAIPKRPKNSVLALDMNSINAKIYRSWQDGLKRYLMEKGYIS